MKHKSTTLVIFIAIFFTAMVFKACASTDETGPPPSPTDSRFGKLNLSDRGGRFFSIPKSKHYAFSRIETGDKLILQRRQSRCIKFIMLNVRYRTRDGKMPFSVWEFSQIENGRWSCLLRVVRSRDEQRHGLSTLVLV